MSEEFDEIAELAQKYVALKPVIILGTGATIPLGLPSMPTLAEALVNKITVGNGDADYEAWESFKAALDRTQDLERALNEAEIRGNLLDRVVDETWKLNTQKDLRAYLRVAGDPSQLQLARLLEHLLRTAIPTVSIVTTNYATIRRNNAAMTAATIVARSLSTDVCSTEVSVVSLAEITRRCIK
jgi:hypothetical protein